MYVWTCLIYTKHFSLLKKMVIFFSFLLTPPYHFPNPSFQLSATHSIVRFSKNLPGWMTLSVICTPGVIHSLITLLVVYRSSCLTLTGCWLLKGKGCQEMATHSSILAWRIPGTGEPSGLPSMGSHRVGHDWSDLAAAAVFNKVLAISRYKKGFPSGAVVMNLPASAGDARDTVLVLGQEDPWRRKWQPTPVFLPGKSHGQRSLAGYSPWARKDLDTTEHTHTHTRTHTHTHTHTHTPKNVFS